MARSSRRLGDGGAGISDAPQSAEVVAGRCRGVIDEHLDHGGHEDHIRGTIACNACRECLRVVGRDDGMTAAKHPEHLRRPEACHMKHRRGVDQDVLLVRSSRRHPRRVRTTGDSHDSA